MALIVGEGGRDDHEAVALETRKKNWIRNRREPEKAPESLLAGIRLVKDAFPEVRPISASAVYNCAGMVFGARRTWVALREIPKILSDDGFRVEGDRAAWRPGDVVLYRKTDGHISHVGAIHSVEGNIETGDFRILVQSAWGETGEFIHELHDVPMRLGDFSQVWTQHKDW